MNTSYVANVFLMTSYVANGNLSPFKVTYLFIKNLPYMSYIPALSDCCFKTALFSLR